MVRRRRDERHARSGVTQARDHLRHLEAGKLAALAGLCALGDLDLKLLAGVQIFGRHPEAAARDLLDDRIGVVAVLVRRVARAVFPAFARHGLSADRSEDHTSELQSLMRISYAVFCLKKKKTS